MQKLYNLKHYPLAQRIDYRLYIYYYGLETQLSSFGQDLV